MQVHTDDISKCLALAIQNSSQICGASSDNGASLFSKGDDNVIRENEIEIDSEYMNRCINDEKKFSTFKDSVGTEMVNNLKLLIADQLKAMTDINAQAWTKIKDVTASKITQENIQKIISKAVTMGEIHSEGSRNIIIGNKVKLHTSSITDNIKNSSDLTASVVEISQILRGSAEAKSKSVFDNIQKMAENLFNIPSKVVFGVVLSLILAIIFIVVILRSSHGS